MVWKELELPSNPFRLEKSGLASLKNKFEGDLFCRLPSKGEALVKIMQPENSDAKNLALLICLVPTNQQPIYRYQCLKESKFFRWAILNRSIYVAKLLAVWVGGVLLAYAILIGSVSYSIELPDLLRGAIVDRMAVLFALLMLYAVWRNLYFDLRNLKIVYELPKSIKTVVWTKSELMLMRDRLIARFQVLPILQRLKQTILWVFFSSSFLILLLIIWKLI